MGIGAHTLQRKLETEGKQYHRIVNDARDSHAREFLSLRSATISAIAFSLGYETPTILVVLSRMPRVFLLPNTAENRKLSFEQPLL